MAAGGDDNTLIKVAVFGITMSIIATCMVAWYATGTGDYDYDTINAYRSDLTTFSGGQLVNDTPWILTGVYTPFIPSEVDDEDVASHVDADGWLFGSKITDYAELNKSADIHLDKNNKSSQLLSIGSPYSWEYRNGKSWWNGGNDYGIIVLDPSIVGFFKRIAGQDTSNVGYELETGTANNWNYTGYRYTFDPTLPFAQGASSKDGTLSLVWYDTGEDTGLSGALQIYGSSKDGSQILLAHYSAYDIISAFQSSGGYVQIYDFDFKGVHLNLTVRFDPTVFSKYATLMDAWRDGAWSMSISSASAGNFFDVENSNAFNVTAGTMFDTFIQIFTFQYPHFDDPWADVVLWLLIGLPMTIALLCITTRVVGGVFKIF